MRTIKNTKQNEGNFVRKKMTKKAIISETKQQQWSYDM